MGLLSFFNKKKREHNYKTSLTKEQLLENPKSFLELALNELLAVDFEYLRPIKSNNFFYEHYEVAQYKLTKAIENIKNAINSDETDDERMFAANSLYRAEDELRGIYCLINKKKIKEALRFIEIFKYLYFGEGIGINIWEEE